MASGPVTLVSIRDLSFCYGSVRALDGLSLEIRACARLGVVGPNGSGKSTLIDLVSGARQPTRGSVLLDDRTQPIRPEVAVAAGVARTFQTARVVGTQSIVQNVLNGVLACRRERWRSAASVARAMQLIETAGIADYASVPANAVPAGVLRLTEVARAVFMAPRLLLLDEPYAGLSAEESRAVASLIELAAARQPELAVLIVDHDYRRLACAAGEMLLLVAGRLAWRGPPEHLEASPEFIAGYLGGGRTE